MAGVVTISQTGSRFDATLCGRGVDFGRLKDIEPTPAPDLWAKEAEQFVFGGELAGFVRRYKDDLSIMIAKQEGVVVAVGVMYLDLKFYAARLGSIVVDHRVRRIGFGMAMLQAMVTEVLKTGTACWLVHPNDAGMLTCSRRAEPKPDETSIDDGYVMFIAPLSGRSTRPIRVGPNHRGAARFRA